MYSCHHIIGETIKFFVFYFRDQVSGMVIARCSQPEVGWFGHRLLQDEWMLDDILRACVGTVEPNSGMNVFFILQE